jgi:hypothetical protein
MKSDLKQLQSLPIVRSSMSTVRCRGATVKVYNNNKNDSFFI